MFGYINFILKARRLRKDKHGLRLYETCRGRICRTSSDIPICFAKLNFWPDSEGDKKQTAYIKLPCSHSIPQTLNNQTSICWQVSRWCLGSWSHCSPPWHAWSGRWSLMAGRSPVQPFRILLHLESYPPIAVSVTYSTRRLVKLIDKWIRRMCCLAACRIASWRPTAKATCCPVLSAKSAGSRSGEPQREPKTCLNHQLEKGAKPWQNMTKSHKDPS